MKESVIKLREIRKMEKFMGEGKREKIAGIKENREIYGSEGKGEKLLG